MVTAAGEGRAAEAWVRLSVPTGDDVPLFRAMAIAHRAVEAPGDDVAAAAQQAIARWEGMIQKETRRQSPSLSQMWSRTIQRRR